MKRQRLTFKCYTGEKVLDITHCDTPDTALSSGDISLHILPCEYPFSMLSFDKGEENECLTNSSTIQAIVYSGHYGDFFRTSLL